MVTEEEEREEREGREGGCWQPRENRGAGAGSQMQWGDWSPCLGICCSRSLFTQFCWSHFRYWIQPTIVIASMAKASSYFLWKEWGNNPKRSSCSEQDVPEPPFHRPRGHAGLRAPLMNNHRQDSHLLLDSSLFHAKFSKLHQNSHRVPQRQHTSLLSPGTLRPELQWNLPVFKQWRKDWCVDGVSGWWAAGIGWVSLLVPGSLKELNTGSLPWNPYKILRS